MSFDSLGLSPALLRAVSEQGYTQPTPIQAASFPSCSKARDVMAGAQTGTGKTAGFTLPLLQRLDAKHRPPHAQRRVRALILTPTRELAAQVAESVKNYGKHMPFKTAVDLRRRQHQPADRPAAARRRHLVATPGRLLDHAQQRTVDLRHVEIFVLDEADRMLDMGFLPDIRRVIAMLPQQRQNLLFSATFPDDIRALANKLLHSPVSDRGRRAQRRRGQDRAGRVLRRQRPEARLAVVAHRLRQLAAGARVHAHEARREPAGRAARAATDSAPRRSTATRAKARARARSPTSSASAVRVLVATDIAARGLDIDQLPHVVNYDLPEVAEHYVHRIGRTGRAGNEGLAVSLVGRDERPLLKTIERLLGYAVAIRQPDGYVPPAPRPAERRSRRARSSRRNGGARRHGSTAASTARRRRRPAPRRHAITRHGSRSARTRARPRPVRPRGRARQARRPRRSHGAGQVLRGLTYINEQTTTRFRGEPPCRWST